VIEKLQNSTDLEWLLLLLIVVNFLKFLQCAALCTTQPPYTLMSDYVPQNDTAEAWASSDHLPTCKKSWQAWHVQSNLKAVKLLHCWRHTHSYNIQLRSKALGSFGVDVSWFIFLCSQFLYVLSSSCWVSVLFFWLKSFLFAFLLVLFDAIAIIMAESSCWFQTCNRNTVCRLVFTLA